jgi:hypothetical protein
MMATVLDRLTLEETLNLRQHQVFRAIIRLLRQEMNATRAFEAALTSDMLQEINRRRAFDAAIVGDLLQRLNELRALIVTSPPLPPLTVADLAAKGPRQATPADFGAQPRPQLTAVEMFTAVKAQF